MPRSSKHLSDIAPDEIFLDDRNLPEFDEQQFEGRIERPIGRTATIIFLIAAFLATGVFGARAAKLQISEGQDYLAESEQNRLEHQLIFPERGIIYDRNGKELAWNVPASEELGFSLRAYIKEGGFGHILGYLRYPARDRSGVYYRTDYEADVGIEAYYNARLKGTRGLRILETDALGNVRSANVIDPPTPGENITLAIDRDVQRAFYDVIKTIALERDFRGGAGAMMDLRTGEMIALVSFPEFDSNIMTAGEDRAAIAAYNADERTPFLNRAVTGLYTPGSIVKPIYAIGALKEKIISPEAYLYCPKSISIPNPYFPDQPTIFNDWKDHGYLNMREAIAWSSDVYFYTIAGGFGGQKGLGIAKVEEYARLFGFGKKTGIDLFGESEGVVPNPEWKEKMFSGDPWRIGDTYFTGIGQYGVQVTLLQALQSAAIIGARGHVHQPRLLKADGPVAESAVLPIESEYFRIAGEGMRLAVTEGTAKGLNLPWVDIAAKTGTAELGVTKMRVNSWVIGFFPYEKPTYAFAVVMDRGPKGNPVNATSVAGKVFLIMASSSPEYF